MWNFPECIISHTLCIVSYFSFSSKLWHNANANSSFMDRHIKAPHTSSASTSLNHEVTLNKQTGSYCSLSLVHTCTRLKAHTERKHALNKSSLGLVCFWYLGLIIRVVHCWSFKVFLCFHSEMWKLLHMGIIVFVRKRHHSVGLRVEAMTCLISRLCINMNYVWFLMWHNGSLFIFIIWHVYMEKYKVQSRYICSLNVCVFRSRWLLFQPFSQDISF